MIVKEYMKEEINKVGRRETERDSDSDRNRERERQRLRNRDNSEFTMVFRTVSPP